MLGTTLPHHKNVAAVHLIHESQICGAHDLFDPLKVFYDVFGPVIHAIAGIKGIVGRFAHTSKASEDAVSQPPMSG